MEAPFQLDFTADMRVLVADDNVDAATSLCFLLQMLGCRTAVAYDGETAVQVAMIFKPHLSFLDLDMPGLDGCSALAAMQEKMPDHSQMFVCLTGRSERTDEARCLAAGFHSFVSKPMEVEDLAKLLAICKQRVVATAQRDGSMEGGAATSVPGQPDPSDS